MATEPGRKQADDLRILSILNGEDLYRHGMGHQPHPNGIRI